MFMALSVLYGNIVENHVDRIVRRYLAFDAMEETDELLLAVALHLMPDDGAIDNVERGKQRRCAVPHVTRELGIPQTDSFDLINPLATSWNLHLER